MDFIDRELDPFEEDGKEARLDILGLEKATGAKVNIEVQVSTQKYFGKRSLYYWSRLYNNLKRGNKYSDLNRTVTINILDFVLFEDESEATNWHNYFGIYNPKTGLKLTEDFEMHFIELPKWKIYKDIKDMNSLEYWTSYFDKKTEKNELEEITMYAPMVKEAVKRESIFTQDEIKRRAYDLREKAERDRIGQLDYAMEKGREKGRTEMNLLIKYLLSEGKTDELLAVTSDDSLCEKLLKKYHIV